MAEPRRLFHLAPLEAWREHERSLALEWRPASLAREGFLHLSFAEQLAGTLALHFAAARALAFVELHPERVASDLRLEPARGGERFPHLYRPLRASDVRRVVAIERRAHGWELPDELAERDSP